MKTHEFHDTVISKLATIETKVEQTDLRVMALDVKMERQNGRVGALEKTLAWWSGGAAVVGMLGASLWRWIAEGRK